MSKKLQKKNSFVVTIWTDAPVKSSDAAAAIRQVIMASKDYLYAKDGSYLAGDCTKVTVTPVGEA